MKTESEQRDEWAVRRQRLEARRNKNRTGLFHPLKLARIFGRGFKSTLLYRKGVTNAVFPKLTRHTLGFEHLPSAFDGYTILYMTDLHLDSHPDLVRHVRECIVRISREHSIDLCLMGGDYALGFGLDDRGVVLSGMKELVSVMPAEDGIAAVLGNHDALAMVAPFENLGIQLLINQSQTISRKGESITLTGLDDPHDFYTNHALTALKEKGSGFRIALIHTPELFREARESQVDLYLSGHTHGGQICLPGGIPLYVSLKTGHRFYKGTWQYKGMKGYTGQGLGTVGIPVRLNTVSEIALITLKKEQR